MPRTNHSWKSPEIARIRKLAAAGLTRADIARAMTLPLTAIDYIKRRYRIRIRPAQNGGRLREMPPPWWWKGTP